MRPRILALLPATLLSATLAWAFTEQELTDRAEILLADYQALEVQVAACPNGECNEAQQILDDFDALEVERQQLHDDRATLTGCGCVALDALIDDIDAISGVVWGTLVDWDEQG